MILCVSHGEKHGKFLSLWGLEIRLIVVLCWAITSPLRYCFSHVDRRWGHASLTFWEHSEQLGLGCVRGRKMLFL